MSFTSNESFSQISKLIKINLNQQITSNTSKNSKNTQNMTKKEPKIENIMTKHHKTDFKTNSGFF